ncbi:hypothetical protein G6016_01550 [Dietzia aerolata]|uniref:Ribosomally synthesized peptide with SipW-like signal peptide n=1 Tax=Dietzia aerolata TaxID=595984 RepID=A0ABV5JQN0_9ACTN|nr:hypothetical protein [Dietzia aerolata]MBB0967664.1 hypothetical protein [Dietzia aerolata]
MGKHAASTARLRKASLAGGMVFGIGAAATLSAWSDASLSGAVFDAEKPKRAGLFELQSAPSPDSFDDQAESMATMATRGIQELESTSVSTSVVLTPGRDTFLPVYLRTSEDSDSGAIVSVSQASNGGSEIAPTPATVWGDQNTPGFVSYGARLHRVDDPASAPECNLDLFDARNADSELLFGTEPGPANAHDGLVAMDAEAPSTQFALAGRAENMYLVCFRFHLDPSVMVEAPESNGAPFQPSWTFTGEAIDQ